DLTYIDLVGPIPPPRSSHQPQLPSYWGAEQADWHCGRTGLALLPHQPAISESRVLGSIHRGLDLPAHSFSPEEPSRPETHFAFQRHGGDTKRVSIQDCPHLT
ncbi:unnamed protein product, partial [Closterium sp. Naga37s-1]